MIAGESWLDTSGRLLIVACFLITGLSNLTKARIEGCSSRTCGSDFDLR